MDIRWVLLRINSLVIELVLGGIDATVHISEEAKNASIAVPRAIIMSTALGCIFGWG